MGAGSMSDSRRKAAKRWRPVSARFCSAMQKPVAIAPTIAAEHRIRTKPRMRMQPHSVFAPVLAFVKGRIPQDRRSVRAGSEADRKFRGCECHITSAARTHAMMSLDRVSGFLRDPLPTRSGTTEFFCRRPHSGSLARGMSKYSHGHKRRTRPGCGELPSDCLPQHYHRSAGNRSMRIGRDAEGAEGSLHILP